MSDETRNTENEEIEETTVKDNVVKFKSGRQIQREYIVEVLDELLKGPDVDDVIILLQMGDDIAVMSTAGDEKWKILGIIAKAQQCF